MHLLWWSTGAAWAPGSFTPASPSWFDGNNRMVNTALGIQYDAAGNLTAIGGFTFAYDAENRLVSSTLNSVTTTYAYDGEGRRVKKDSVVMVYDAFGRLAAEYGGAADPVGTEYLTADHLGSTRLVTSSTGVERRCLDYLPFGEQMTQGMGMRGACYASANEPRVKFTGKERDAETGLDYFGARYFSGAQGRFTSPDKPFVDQFPDDPQSWNLYAYGRNNPLKYVDQDGEAAWLVGAAVGAIMDVGVQTLIEGKSIRDVDVGSVLISAGAGAVGGGLAAKAGRLAPLAKHLLEGAIDAAGSVAQQVYQKGDVSLTETVIDVAGGRVIGAVAGGAAERVAKNSPEVKQLLKEADRKSRIAANAAEAGNPSSSARRSAQAAALNNQAADRVASRSTAASTAASQATSAAAKRAVAEAKKREEERKRQGGEN